MKNLSCIASANSLKKTTPLSLVRYSILICFSEKYSYITVIMLDY